jgi:FkbM family methyltransferase
MIKSLATAAKRFLRRFGLKVVRVCKITSPDFETACAIPFDYVMASSLFITENFFFVQIGAFDGITGDPIRKFLEVKKFGGLLLEPQKDAFEKLKENCKSQPQLILVNKAVSNSSESKYLYRIRPGTPGLQKWMTQTAMAQIASFSRETILKIFPDMDSAIEKEEVPCATMDSLFDEHKVQKVDLLQIDAEGYDFEILKMFPFSRFKPTIIHFESRHLSKADTDACFRFLVERGYKISIEIFDITAFLEP